MHPGPRLPPAGLGAGLRQKQAPFCPELPEVVGLGAGLDPRVQGQLLGIPTAAALRPQSHPEMSQIQPPSQL